VYGAIEMLSRLGIDDIAWVLQQNRLCLYGHMLRKEDDDWVKKCMEYEVEGPRPYDTRCYFNVRSKADISQLNLPYRRPRGRPKRTWREVVREDCQARKLNKE